MPTILLVRHAQASFGAEDYDVLSERGSLQVAALAESLSRRGVVPTRVVCGSLRRQRDTALPWSAGAGVTVDERWNEYDDDDVLSHHSSSVARLGGGAKTELSSREFQGVLDEALSSWMEAGVSGPAREPWPAFLARVDAAVDAVAGELTRGETAMVFSSSGVIAAVAASLLGAPEHTYVALNRVSVNTAITKIVVGSRGRTLVSYNEHGHLEEAGGDLLTYR
ncbi:MAG TPA: histidine phosphatase family protein [Pseudonocardia sp.]|nr:histidine phosphatase family protein [Pseudonocardia sp.]